MNYRISLNPNFSSVDKPENLNYGPYKYPSSILQIEQSNIVLRREIREYEREIIKPVKNIKTPKKTKKP